MKAFVDRWKWQDYIDWKQKYVQRKGCCAEKLAKKKGEKYFKEYTDETARHTLATNSDPKWTERVQGIKQIFLHFFI